MWPVWKPTLLQPSCVETNLLGGLLRYSLVSWNSSIWSSLTSSSAYNSSSLALGPFLGHSFLHLLLPTFSVPCCSLPVLYLHQIYGFPQNSTPLSFSRIFNGSSFSETSFHYSFFGGGTRIICPYCVASPQESLQE